MAASATAAGRRIGGYKCNRLSSFRILADDCFNVPMALGSAMTQAEAVRLLPFPLRRAAGPLKLPCAHRR
jgi:hypothetical protein